MLKKLLKYDIKDIYKGLVIFYILSIIFSILTRIFLSIENSFILNIIGQVCSGVTISMLFNILINNLMRLWGRFTQNLYKDESYLTHTLPVEKKNIYISKILTSIITLFTSILVIALSIFIAYYSKENLNILKNLLLPLVNIYDSTMLGILSVLFLIFFLEFINALQSGYTGIILGHKMNNNKIIFSILFGFATYTVIQVFGLLIIFIVSLFNKDLMNLFITNDIINIDMLKIIIYLSIFIYSISFIVFYIINIKLFKKGVNVD